MENRRNIQPSGDVTEAPDLTQPYNNAGINNHISYVANGTTGNKSWMMKRTINQLSNKLTK